MLKTEDLMRFSQRSTREEVLELKRERAKYRALFNCSEGIAFLHKVIVDSGMLEVKDPSDVASAGGRNFAISLVDALGLFDEDKLDSILKLALSCEDLRGAFDRIKETEEDGY